MVSRGPVQIFPFYQSLDNGAVASPCCPCQRCVSILVFGIDIDIRSVKEYANDVFMAHSGRPRERRVAFVVHGVGLDIKTSKQQVHDSKMSPFCGQCQGCDVKGIPGVCLDIFVFQQGLHRTVVSFSGG